MRAYLTIRSKNSINQKVTSNALNKEFKKKVSRKMEQAIEIMGIEFQ